jgi:hypothetical protein
MLIGHKINLISWSFYIFSNSLRKRRRTWGWLWRYRNNCSRLSIWLRNNNSLLLFLSNESIGQYFTLTKHFRFLFSLLFKLQLGLLRQNIWNIIGSFLGEVCLLDCTLSILVIKLVSGHFSLLLIGRQFLNLIFERINQSLIILVIRFLLSQLDALCTCLYLLSCDRWCLNCRFN